MSSNSYILHFVKIGKLDVCPVACVYRVADLAVPRGPRFLIFLLFFVGIGRSLESSTYAPSLVFIVLQISRCPEDLGFLFFSFFL